MRRLIVAVLAPAVALPAWASAEPINLTMLSNYSRATFKSDAPLETIVGTTAGPAVTGSLTVDPLKSIDIEGPLEPGKEVLAKVRGILTIKQKPFETVADARVTYIRLTPAQVEAQKRFGFTSENVKARVRFGTTFSNHGITIPQLMSSSCRTRSSSRPT